MTTGVTRDRTVFLQSFLRDWRTIGSVTPSSQYLVRAMLDRVDFGRVKRIVEYGPGTGVFTTEIMHRLAPDGQLLTLDTEEHFITDLRQRIPDPRLVAVRGSAALVERHIAALGWDGADAIISGIPYTAMPASLRVGILQASARALAPQGLFTAYQYSPYIRHCWVKFTERSKPAGCRAIYPRPFSSAAVTERSERHTPKGANQRATTASASRAIREALLIIRWGA